MARLTFPAEAQRLIYIPGSRRGAALMSAKGAQVTIWDAASGGALADIVELDGITEIEGSMLEVDDNSLLPQFMGPDGVEVLYLEIAGEDGRFPIYNETYGGGDGVGPVEILPATFSRFVPHTSWRWGGYTDDETIPSLNAMRPPTQPQGDINVMIMPVSAVTATTPITASWEGVPLALINPAEGPLRISIRGGSIWVASETPTPLDDFEIVIKAWWIDASDAVGGAVPVVSDEVVVGPFPWVDITDPDTNLSDPELFAPAGAEFPVPEGITTPVLGAMALWLRDEATGLPIGSAHLAAIASISLYQGDTVLVPRLTAGNKLIQGISDPQFTRARISGGYFFNNTSLDLDPTFIKFSAWGSEYTDEPEHSVTFAMGLDTEGEPYPFVRTGEAFRVGWGPAVPEDVVRKLELDGLDAEVTALGDDVDVINGLLSDTIDDVEALQSSGNLGLITPITAVAELTAINGQVNVPYNRHVVHLSEAPGTGSVDLVFPNPGEFKYARFLLRAAQNGTGNGVITSTQSGVNFNGAGLTSTPSRHTVWEVLVIGQGTADVGIPESVSLALIADDVQ